MTIRSFDEVVPGALPGLLRYAAVLTADPDLADDLIQDVLTRAFLKWSKVQAADNPEAYLTRMVTNEFISSRRRRRHRTLALRVEQPAPGSVTAAMDDQDELRQLLSGLSPRQHAALVLRHYLGYSDVDAAAMIGCSVSTIRSLIARGLTALRISHADGLVNDSADAAGSLVLKSISKADS